MQEEPVSVLVSLSAAEVRFIVTGLDRIWSAHALWEATGKLPNAHPNVLLDAPGFDRGDYRVDQMAIVLASRDRLRALASGGPLEMDAFELAACLLAVRVTEKLLLHRHIKAWRGKHQEASRRLLVKLEAYRKRAKRRFITANGSAAFAEASQKWKRFVRCLRVVLLYCPCNRTRHVGLGRIRRLKRKEEIDALLPEILHLLPRWGRAVPAEPDLRRLLGTALHSAKCYKRRRQRRGLKTEPEKIRRHVFGYVARRCPEGPDPHELLTKAQWSVNVSEGETHEAQ